MTTMWIACYVMLWLLVLGEGILILALARQIGVLHNRLAPTGARITNVGLELGAEAPRFSERDLRGNLVTLGVQYNKPTMLIFISPNCSACSELAPSIRTVYQHEQKDTEIIVVSLAQDEEENRSYAKQHGLNTVPYVLAPYLADIYHVSTSPYAVLIDKQGKIYTKGIVNGVEHLESLLNALDQGYASFDQKMNEILFSNTQVK